MRGELCAYQWNRLLCVGAVHWCYISCDSYTHYCRCSYCDTFERELSDRIQCSGSLSEHSWVPGNLWNQHGVCDCDGKRTNGCSMFSVYDQLGYSLNRRNSLHQPTVPDNHLVCDHSVMLSSNNPRCWRLLCMGYMWDKQREHWNKPSKSHNFCSQSGFCTHSHILWN